jgi:hypothetical protein
MKLQDDHIWLNVHVANRDKVWRVVKNNMTIRAAKGRRCNEGSNGQAGWAGMCTCEELSQRLTSNYYGMLIGGLG